MHQLIAYHLDPSNISQFSRGTEQRHDLVPLSHRGNEKRSLGFRYRFVHVWLASGTTLDSLSPAAHPPDRLAVGQLSSDITRLQATNPARFAEYRHG